MSIRYELRCHCLIFRYILHAGQSSPFHYDYAHSPSHNTVGAIAHSCPHSASAALDEGALPFEAGLLFFGGWGCQLSLQRRKLSVVETRTFSSSSLSGSSLARLAVFFG